MPNNLGPLQSSGPISLADVANAFYLFKPYTDLTTARLYDYTGDKIKYYYPSTRDGSTNIPDASANRIELSDFYGKRYGLPIPLTVTGTVYNYNVYDNAEAYAVSRYGLSLTDPNIPFFITLTNNGSIQANGTLINAATYNYYPALNIGASSNGAHSIGRLTSVAVTNNGTIIGAANNNGGPKGGSLGASVAVPYGVSTINYTIQGGGGGGGGGTEKLNGGGGAGGGGGGSASGSFAVR